MVQVKIIKEGTVYNVGEIVKCSEAEAQEIVKLGDGEIVDEIKEKAKEFREKKSKELSKDDLERNIKEIWKEKEDKLKQVIESFSSKEDLAKQIFKTQPYFYDSSKNWWLWLKNKWEMVDDIEILLMVKKISPANTVNSKEKTEILEVMKQEGRDRTPESIKKTWIQFDDKIIDIKTDEKFKATPEFFITNPIPYKIKKLDKTPIMDKIFDEWVGKEHIQTLYEVIAYCLLPDYPIHRLFCLVGPGSNGKTCFLRLITKFVGINNITSTELDDLLDSRFERAKLYKKLVCLMGETNFNTISKTSLIKRLTGQDTISFEFKNKTPFDNYNYSKIIIATNGLPYSEDKTIGFYRRWCIINFPNKFSEEKDILDDIPEEEYNNLTKKSIKILKDLLKNRKFTNEGNIEQRKEKYEELSNPVNKFIDEECIKGFDTEIPFFRFYEELLKFIDNSGYRKLSKPEVSRILRREGFEIKTAKKYRSDSSQTTWKIIDGLNLKYEEIKPRFEIIKDISNIVVEGLEDKNIGDIIVWNKELNDALEILKKEKYIKRISENDGK